MIYEQKCHISYACPHFFSECRTFCYLINRWEWLFTRVELVRCWYVSQTSWKPCSIGLYFICKSPNEFSSFSEHFWIYFPIRKFYMSRHPIALCSKCFVNSWRQVLMCSKQMGNARFPCSFWQYFLL